MHTVGAGLHGLQLGFGRLEGRVFGYERGDGFRIHVGKVTGEGWLAKRMQHGGVNVLAGRLFMRQGENKLAWRGVWVLFAACL
ncbi:hypothetical protein EBZ70_01770 [bacterium]|nr:hypothetical protein [bacterium]